jgi:glycine cleavage system H protein
MNIPEGLKYSKEHEWLKSEGNVATIGITDYAQGELGDIVFIDIDSDQGDVNSGDTFGTIEAVKTVSDLYTDPYGEGWLVKIELSDPGQIDSLMDASAYEAEVS